MARPYTKITEQVFNAVKVMLKGGATQKEAAEYLRISYQTVNRIARSETFQEYVNMVYADGKNRYTRTDTVTDDKQKGGTLSANYQINRIYEQLKTLNETMTIISNKLAFIVDELTGVKS